MDLRTREVFGAFKKQSPEARFSKLPVITGPGARFSKDPVNYRAR